jgi:peptidoglycan hydrolase-like protein with peptidoglycan-binding domain
MQPRRRTAALVVTAATGCVLGFASTALANTSGLEAQSTARPADLIPDASWRGRPIKRPDRAPIQLSQPAASTVIRQGAGFRDSAGSDAVRDIQRRLHALGYRPGPVDGVFGPRTRSAVGWFQIKHRLPATGAVDGTTLTILRFRTHGVLGASAPPPERPVATAPRPEVATAPAATASPPVAHGAPAPRVVHPAQARKHETGTGLAALLLGLALALVVVASITTWLRSGARLPDRERLRKIFAPRTQATRVPARSPASRRDRPTRGAVAASTNGRGRQVIGYAVGRSERDFLRQRHAIERICGERGWTLAALVKERDARGRKRRQPGLAHVLGQVASGGVGKLIVGRLQSLARSPAELAVVLEWCRRRDVELVALDVGLDTTTPDGRLAARCLGAVAPRPARPQPASGRGNGNRNVRTSGVR